MSSWRTDLGGDSKIRVHQDASLRHTFHTPTYSDASRSGTYRDRAGSYGCKYRCGACVNGLDVVVPSLTSLSGTAQVWSTAHELSEY